MHRATGAPDSVCLSIRIFRSPRFYITDCSRARVARFTRVIDGAGSAEAPTERAPFESPHADDLLTVRFCTMTRVPERRSLVTLIGPSRERRDVVRPPPRAGIIQIYTGISNERLRALAPGRCITRGQQICIGVLLDAASERRLYCEHLPPTTGVDSVDSRSTLVLVAICPRRRVASHNRHDFDRHKRLSIYKTAL